MICWGRYNTSPHHIPLCVSRDSHLSLDYYTWDLDLPPPITPSVNSMSFPQPARHSLVGTELQIQDSLLALWTWAGDLVPLRLSFPQKERGRVLQIWPRGLPFPTISPTPRPRPQSYPFPGQESNAGGHFVADTNCPLTP